MPVHADFHIVAAALFILFPLVVLAVAETQAALDRRRRRLRREGWREHRAYIDSLEAARWRR